jgi:dihydrofolate synthase/folylpolyglutamate synthase
MRVYPSLWRFYCFEVTAIKTKSDRMMTYKETVLFLKSLNPLGIRLGLEQMSGLLARMADPQNAFPTVIIAGTNGKGSVASMTASILSAAGYKTGLYTSPDLIDFRERIRIDGEMISESETVSCVASVQKHVVETVSYFEFITAMAFLYFQRQNVDIAVLEVGLGGRLDATNVVTPLVSVITNISLEHQDYLGDTLAAIAVEKAGVVKPNGVCLTAARQKAVLAVLDSVCREKNAALYRLGRDIRTMRSKNGVFSYRGIGRDFKGLHAPFTGSHQITNAALALGVIEMIDTPASSFSISDEAVFRGLSDARWEGRLEILDHAPLLLVDGAHNQAGVSTLCRALAKDFVYRKLVLVFGVMGDKNYRVMARMLFPLAETVILTRPPSDRALPPQHLVPLATSYNRNVLVVEDPEEALNRARLQAASDDLICAAGSLYLVGEIKRIHAKSRIGQNI